MSHPELIVMLTKDDYTVTDACEIFDACKNSDVKFWGAKEMGLSRNKLKELYRKISESGKTGVLEVVAYTEDECLDGAHLAAECGCGILLGTVYYDSVNMICKEHGIRYMPFIGNVSGRPSVLEGSIESIINDASSLIDKGVFGFDLLGYRYTGDAFSLNSAFVSEVASNVCLAGSIDSFERLDEVIKISPWAFTIGSAFFDHKFGDSFNEQIETVTNYINRILQ